ncbi:MAG: hypothetical protein ACR2RE_15860 [Geminicoccaceae bacterium]
MTFVRGLVFCLLTMALSGCSTLFGNLWPTVPKGLDAVRQTSGHVEPCNTFEVRYGGDKAALPRFVSTLISGEWQPPEPSAISDDLPQEVKDKKEEPGYLSQERIRNHFDNFLDCYYVDLSRFKKEEGKVYTPQELDNLKQLYALRGNAIVTVLARYAAYNLTGRIGGGLHTTAFPPYEDIPGDATNVLTRIEHAQRLIRKDAPKKLRFDDAEKPQVQLTDESLHGFSSVQRVNRIFSVIQLAFEAERPTLRRAEGFLSQLAGIVTQQSFTDLGNVVKHAVAGLEKAALLGVLGRAYQFDANAVFEDLKSLDDAPGPEHWKKVDDALRDACDHLAVIANGAVPHCLPPEAPEG